MLEGSHCAPGLRQLELTPTGFETVEIGVIKPADADCTRVDQAGSRAGAKSAARLSAIPNRALTIMCRDAERVLGIPRHFQGDAAANRPAPFGIGMRAECCWRCR